MADDKTISVYDTRTAQYRVLVDSIGEPAGLKKFIAALPAGGRALDLGCGVGNCATIMAKRGLAVECIDASAEMVKSAIELYGLSARHAGFADLDDCDLYDGIWANFSLLHAAKSELPQHIAAVHRALRSNGVFFIALKIGDGESRDDFGRFYAYYQKTELQDVVEQAGFRVFESIGGIDKGLAGHLSEWVGLLCRKLSQ